MANGQALAALTYLSMAPWCQDLVTALTLQAELVPVLSQRCHFLRWIQERRRRSRRGKRKRRRKQEKERQEEETTRLDKIHKHKPCLREHFHLFSEPRHCVLWNKPLPQTSPLWPVQGRGRSPICSALEVVSITALKLRASQLAQSLPSRPLSWILKSNLRWFHLTCRHPLGGPLKKM